MMRFNIMRPNNWKISGIGQNSGILSGIGIVFMVIFYLIIIVDLVLIGIALWKYISKN